MSLASENDKVNRFFGFLKNWDRESKEALIVKLKKSINYPTKQDFSSCFGAWEDERSTEEIVSDIRNDRVNQRDIEDF